MLKIRLLGTTLALTAAVGVLFISLSTVSSVQSASGVDQPKHFYMSGTLLPDHIAYPVVMMVDRAHLEAATPTEQVYLKTEYANRRLEYAQQLLDKSNANLAVTTLTKAQKYLLSAASQAIEMEMPDTVLKHVIATLEYHKEETTEIAQQLSDNERAVIDGLNEEVSVMIEQLNSQLQ
jgi:hypothetical protein